VILVVRPIVSYPLEIAQNQDGARTVVGKWNENGGGASRTERPDDVVTMVGMAPRVLDRSRLLEIPNKWAPFQRLVSPNY